MTSARIVSLLGILVVSIAAALLQFSFFPALSGISPNALFVLFFCLIFFAGSPYEKLAALVIIGLLLDLFSGTYFGIHVLLLLLVYGFERLIFHFLRGDYQHPSLPYFIGLFVVTFFLYTGLQYGLSFVTASSVLSANSLLAEFILSGFAAIIGFLVYGATIGNSESTHQLTLFK